MLTFNMNIFWLSKSIKRCARYYCDKHCVKIILEITQVLFTAHWVFGPVCWEFLPAGARPYRITHKNHPVSVWVRARAANYTLAARLGLALCEEYAYRYGKIHKCEALLRALLNNLPPEINSKSDKPSIPPQCMPDVHKTIDPKTLDDVVCAYRKYYVHEKRALLSYKKRNTPAWIKIS